MGGSKNYNSDGGFSEYDFKQVGTTANGIKIIEPKNKGDNTKTPMFSNTPNTMYVKTSDGLVNQVTAYGRGKDKRAKSKDIDFGHPHTNPDKKLSFAENNVHVHEYDENGKRSNYARKPSKKERRLIMVARYGKRV